MPRFPTEPAFEVQFDVRPQIQRRLPAVFLDSSRSGILDQHVVHLGEHISDFAVPSSNDAKRENQALRVVNHQKVLHAIASFAPRAKEGKLLPRKICPSSALARDESLHRFRKQRRLFTFPPSAALTLLLGSITISHRTHYGRTVYIIERT